MPERQGETGEAINCTSLIINSSCTLLHERLPAPLWDRGRPQALIGVSVCFLNSHPPPSLINTWRLATVVLPPPLRALK